MVKIKVMFPESRKKQRKIADEVRHTAYECAEELWEAMLDVMDIRTARCFERALLRLLDRGDCDDVGIKRPDELDNALAGLEGRLMTAFCREYTMKSWLGAVKREYEYDYVLIDCMPSLNVLTVNALAAANSVIIPCQASCLSAKGLQQLMGSVARVRRNINPGLKIDGILLTMVDTRTNNAKSIISSLREIGGGLRVLDTEIPFSVRAAECSVEGNGGYFIALLVCCKLAKDKPILCRPNYSALHFLFADPLFLLQFLLSSRLC